MSQLKRETRSLPDIEDGEKGRARRGEKRDRGGPGTTHIERRISKRGVRKRDEQMRKVAIEMMEGEGKRGIAQSEKVKRMYEEEMRGQVRRQEGRRERGGKRERGDIKSGPPKLR